MTMYLRKLTYKYVATVAAVAGGDGSGSNPANPMTVAAFIAWAVANSASGVAANSFGWMADGHYTAANDMLLAVGGNLMYGKPGGYINFRAVHDGAVEIDGGGAGSTPGTLITCKFGVTGQQYIWLHGINAHGSNNNAFEFAHTDYCIGTRLVGWDANPGYNYYPFQINYGTYNTFEDCAAFGTGRKMFLAYSTSGPNYFRRCWGRWQFTYNVGPKIGQSCSYHSYDSIVENCIYTWDDSYMNAPYLSQNNGILNVETTATDSRTVLNTFPYDLTFTLGDSSDFTIQLGKTVRMWSAADGANGGGTYVQGTITGLSGKTITLTVTSAGGVGNTRNDWNLQALFNNYNAGAPYIVTNSSGNLATLTTSTDAYTVVAPPASKLFHINLDTSGNRPNNVGPDPYHRIRMWSASDGAGGGGTFVEGVCSVYNNVLVPPQMTLAIDTVGGIGNNKSDWNLCQWINTGPINPVTDQPYGPLSQDGLNLPADPADSGIRIRGCMSYQKTGQHFIDDKSGWLGIAGMQLTTMNDMQVKDCYIYFPPGWSGNRGINLAAGYGVGPYNLFATNVTSVNPGNGTYPDTVNAEWTAANVVSGQVLSDIYGASGQTLYTADGTHGAALRYRYINGVLKDGSDGFRKVPLWPWTMNARIKTATQQSGYAVEDLDAWRISQFGKSPDE